MSAAIAIAPAAFKIHSTATDTGVTLDADERRDRPEATAPERAAAEA